MIRYRLAIIIILILVFAVGITAVLSYEGLFNTTSSRTTSQTVYFTIIENDPPNAMAGMNGSYYKGASTNWPIINVHTGDRVVITVINNASSEPHGFGIDHYEPSPGLTISPGQEQTITFVANQAGTFRVYCTIECSIHPLMQSGELIVS